MKTLLKIIAIAIVLLGIETNTFAQLTLNPNATATIVTTIGLAKITDLDFGNLAVTTLAGSCILAPMAGTPTRTPTGGVTLPAFTGNPLAASFTVTGAAGEWVVITIPQTPLWIQRQSGSENMWVNTFTTDQLPYGITGDMWHLQLGGITPDKTFYVGATVDVGISQPAGVYSNIYNTGTHPTTGFPVTVNYQ